MSIQAFKKEVSGLSEFSWYDLLCASAEGKQLDVAMPGFPDPELQKIWIGSSGAKAIKGVYPFYRYVKKQCSLNNLKIDENTRLLDFGCGWGRITRFFFKDMHPDNICGVDTNAKIIDFCNENMIYANFMKIDPLPPISIPDESVDLITAYSVFTHLPEDLAHKWMVEFKRILKPNGLICLTTNSDRFLTKCESLRYKKNVSPWEEYIHNRFKPVDQLKIAYDNGEYIFKSLPDGNAVYGDTVIPLQYIIKEFGKYFQVVNYLGGHPLEPQESVTFKNARTNRLPDESDLVMPLTFKSLDVGGKRIIGWGVGNSYQNVKKYIGCDIDYFIDSDTELQGKMVDSKMIFPPSKILDENMDEVFVFIFSDIYLYEMQAWLENNGFCEEINYCWATENAFF